MPNPFFDHHSPCLCHPTGLDHVVRGTSPAVDRDLLRVITLNVRHGRGPGRSPPRRRAGEYRENVRRVATLLREARADVVALQEADAPSSWSGLEHHVAAFSEEGGFGEFAHGLHMNLCRAALGLSYGTALLSRVPLAEVESRSFRARPLDPKGFVIATVSLGGREVDIASVHLDLVTPVKRRQTATLVRRLAGRRRPLILMGDLNSTGRRPGSTVRRIARDLDLKAFEGGVELATWPSRRPTRRLDWVLISRSLEFHEYRTVPEPVSDHLAVEAWVGVGIP